MKQKTKRVLSYIHSNGGAATTHDITTETSIDDNDAARYQLQKLEEQGYVFTETVEDGHFKVTRATLTSDGKSRVNSYYKSIGEAVVENSKVLHHLLQDLDDEGIIDIEDYREQFGHE